MNFFLIFNILLLKARRLQPPASVLSAGGDATGKYQHFSQVKIKMNFIFKSFL
jgi:hypothetical protein